MVFHDLPKTLVATELVSDFGNQLERIVVSTRAEPNADDCPKGERVTGARCPDRAGGLQCLLQISIADESADIYVELSRSLHSGARVRQVKTQLFLTRTSQFCQ